jgi:hypothetical protein
MCCAEAGDAIRTDNTAAAPRNWVMVILFLLIIDPSTWVVGKQDRDRHHNIPIMARTADHASAILMLPDAQPLDRRNDVTGGTK